MTEPELAAIMRRAASAARGELPPGTLFVLLAFDPPGPGDAPGGIAQYIANVQRAGVVATLRETADRLEAGDEVARVPFRGPEGRR